MSKKIKFSFVTITWNRHQFAEKSLASLAANIAHPEECEIIVMDNGSKDKTPEVLKKYTNSPLFRIIMRKVNHGLDAYKRLIFLAKGEYLVIFDDDVLEFPKGLDNIFADYMAAYPDYGFLALNVVQDEFTKGAKPPIENYKEDVRGDKVVEFGPAGGWCACFRKRDYYKVMFKFIFTKLSMRKSQDGVLTNLFSSKLKLKYGIIKDAVCFHACGPYYAKKFGHMDHEIAKYIDNGLDSIADEYRAII